MLQRFQPKRASLPEEEPDPQQGPAVLEAADADGQIRATGPAPEDAPEDSPEYLEEHTDERLAERIQQGSQEAFSLMISRYEAKILRYVRKFIANRQDAEDVVQEAFVKAYRNIKSFDTQRKFSSWLYRIAHNEAINFLKKRKIESVPLLELDIMFPHLIRDEKGSADEFELNDMVHGSLAALDIKYRAPLLLYYVEGFGYKEIGQILRIPAATVGVRLSRGKAMLQKRHADRSDQTDKQNNA